MAQLLAATQLKPGSFYNAFSSKKALFIRSLEHYNAETVGNRIATHLNAPEPLSAIEDCFMSGFESVPKSQIIGCLLTNTATEIGKLDAEINHVVWAGLQQIESAFKRRLITEQRIHKTGNLNTIEGNRYLESRTSSDTYSGGCYQSRLGEWIDAVTRRFSH